jgi:micrococcal nuclease
MCKYLFFHYIVLNLSLFYPKYTSHIYRCEIIKIIDGDTLVVLTNNQKYKMRLGNIDALEKKQGKDHLMAVNYLKKYLHHEAKCYYQHRGYYGRWIGSVKINGVDLSLNLVKKGYVFLYPYAKFSSEKEKYLFLNAFILARRKKIGIFKRKKILTPWGFRRQKKLSKKISLK